MKTTPPWLVTGGAQVESLRHSTTAQAVVIGGGVAGLTVAQLLSDEGRDVVLLEEQTCGSGATGKSSGFITPDSELQAEQLLHRFGAHDAGMLWRAAASACEHIRSTIEHARLQCDLVQADSLYVATDAKAASSVKRAHDARLQLRLPSSLYMKDQLPLVLGGDGFGGGVRYSGTFAMTPYRYAAGLREWLRARGVRIFEGSPVTSVENDAVISNGARVRADNIFFCADQQLAHLGYAREAAFHAQTFLATSAPLSPERFRALFPDGNLLVWDTDLVYQYFRRTADDRLLIGGGMLRTTYAKPASPAAVVEHLHAYVRRRLPAIGEVAFTHAWSGLIGVTKDLLPLAGRDARRKRHFYAGCAAGIPWSVLAARCAVDSALRGGSEFQPFFDPCRTFTDLDVLQPVLRKPLTFALSHAYAKGALQGSAISVRRRRPYVLGGLLAALAAVLRLLRRR